MWILPFFVKNTHSTTIKSRMSAATHIAPVVASVNTIERMTQNKFLRYYLEVVIYLVKKFANNQVFAEIKLRNSSSHTIG